MPQLSNLQPDPLDKRDYLFEADPNVTIPEAVDLRQFTGIVEDQERLGSCTANTAASGAEMYLISTGRLLDTPATDDLDLSRLFNYATSRKLLGNFGLDTGSTGRTTMKAMSKFGICRELVWPYVESMVNVDPPSAAYDDALNFKLDSYSRIDTSSVTKAAYAIQYALAKGWPIAVGMRIGERLMSLTPAQEYTFVNPTLNPFAGNHEMLVVGYLQKNGLLYWIMKNSWGAEWCDKGYFLCKYDIVIYDSIDIWVMCGFAGIERVGVDQTIPKPLPAPEPSPPPSGSHSILWLSIISIAMVTFIVYRFGWFTS